MSAEPLEGFTAATANGDIRVRFDDADPAKTISLAIAERILADWRKRNPAQFGYWLATAQTGVEPSKTAKPVKPAAT